MIKETIGLGLRTLAVGLGLLGALLVGMLASPYLGVWPIAVDRARTIAARGYAQLNVVPDRVEILGAVTTSAVSATDALNANNEIVDRIVNGLKADGIGLDRLRTQGFRITPQHPTRGGGGYGDNELITTGYVVRNSIRVILPADQYSGKILDRIIRLGATNIDSVSFSVTDAKRYDREAQRLATEEAREVAEVKANALGMKLGPIVNVDRNDLLFDEGPPRLLAVAPPPAPPPPPPVAIMAREQEFTANVHVVFELE
jgi:uncharacterized protein YggE